jgi:hypothetical protein
MKPDGIIGSVMAELGSAEKLVAAKLLSKLSAADLSKFDAVIERKIAELVDKRLEAVLDGVIEQLTKVLIGKVGGLLSADMSAQIAAAVPRVTETIMHQVVERVTSEVMGQFTDHFAHMVAGEITRLEDRINKSESSSSAAGISAAEFGIVPTPRGIDFIGANLRASCEPVSAKQPHLDDFGQFRGFDLTGQTPIQPLQPPVSKCAPSTKCNLADNPLFMAVSGAVPLPTPWRDGSNTVSIGQSVSVDPSGFHYQSADQVDHSEHVNTLAEESDEEDPRWAQLTHGKYSV